MNCIAVPEKFETSILGLSNPPLLTVIGMKFVSPLHNVSRLEFIVNVGGFGIGEGPLSVAKEMLLIANNKNIPNILTLLFVISIPRFFLVYRL
jgi:hypothetical protein